MSDRVRLILALVTVPVALVIFPLEVILGSPARRLERAYARRAKLPVLRAGTLHVFPVLAPWDLAYGERTLTIDGTELLPLTGISRRPVGLCEQGGRELVFESDANGFRNAAARDSIVDVALVGDSFAQGYCLDAGESIAGRLSVRYPRTLNFGVTGAGPVWELGVFREYAARHRPRVAVWLFYEGNDLASVSVEASGYAGRYLAPEFTQNLATRQDAIDRALIERADSLGRAMSGSLSERIRRTILLREIRARLALSARPREGVIPSSGSSVDRDLETFEKVLALANREASRWGGRILFVYLPDRDRFVHNDSPAADHRDTHDKVIAAVSSLGIDVVDLVPAFASLADPLGLWDAGRVHYNASGYALVADSISSALVRMGVQAGSTTSASRVPALSVDRWVSLRPLTIGSDKREESVRLQR